MASTVASHASAVHDDLLRPDVAKIMSSDKIRNRRRESRTAAVNGGLVRNSSESSIESRSVAQLSTKETDFW